MNERETDMMAAVADNEPQAQTEGVSLAGVLDGEQPIGEKEISEAMAVLEKYKSAKASLDKRIIDNEEWYKLGHWKQYGNRVMEGKRALKFFYFQFFIPELRLIYRVKSKSSYFTTFVVRVFTHFYVVK